VDAHALALEDGEDVRVRVAVTVAGPDADDRDRRAGRREERRVARGRAVVWHDEHLGREALGHPAQQVPLRRALDVPSEEDPSAAPARPEHDRRLVELAPRPGVRTARLRAEDLDDEVAELDRAAGDRRDDRHPPLGGRREDPSGLVALDPDRGHPHRPDGDALEDRRRTTGMVRVGMRDDEEVDAAPALPDEPVGGPGVLAGVDEHPHPGRLEQQGVPLADVDRGQRERCISGRDTARCRPSRDAPGEQQDEGEQQGGHPPSVHDQAPAERTPTGTCGRTGRPLVGTKQRHGTRIAR
jgi:hypothetical protein